jgi:hypothetical protein
LQMITEEQQYILKERNNTKLATAEIYVWQSTSRNCSDLHLQIKDIHSFALRILKFINSVQLQAVRPSETLIPMLHTA